MELSEAYTVLEIDETASVEDANRAKDDLLAAWQPDRFVGDVSFQEKARENLRKVEFAYHLVVANLTARNASGGRAITGNGATLPVRVGPKQTRSSSSQLPPPPPQRMQDAARARRLQRSAHVPDPQKRAAPRVSVLILLLLVGALLLAITWGVFRYASNLPTPSAKEASPTASPGPSAPTAHASVEIPNASSSTSPTALATPRPRIERAVPEAPLQVPPTQAPMLASLPGERFPQTRQRILTATELQSWSASQLRYAINEMYARHGATFLDPEITKVFSSFSWYKPVSENTYARTEALLSPIEVENLKFLGQARQSRPLGSGTNGTSLTGTHMNRPRDSRLIYSPEPPYPDDARRLHASGSGSFEVAFDSAGHVVSVRVVRSTGSRVLDVSSVGALKTWRARPGIAWKTVVPFTYQ